VEQVFDQHEAIVSAVGNGDPDSARQAMMKHMMYSRTVLEDISKSHKDMKHEK
jgi:DNA-binding FadR family transcriptional regulator